MGILFGNSIEIGNSSLFIFFIEDFLLFRQIIAETQGERFSISPLIFQKGFRNFDSFTFGNSKYNKKL